MKSNNKIFATLILILISTQTSYSIDNIIRSKDFESVKDTLKVDNHIKVYLCSMHQEVISNEPGFCSKCGMELIQKSTLETNKMEYTCSMHPEIIVTASGNCPKCGMRLIQKDSNISKGMMGMGMMHHKAKNRGLLYVGMGLMMVIMMVFKIF